MSLSLDMLPDPPNGSEWSLAEMRSGIEGVHRGMIYPVQHWDDPPDDIAPELFSPIVLEASLLPEADLIEFESRPGLGSDCDMQDIVFYADLELRLEDGSVLGSAEAVAFHAVAGSSWTANSFSVLTSDPLASVLQESPTALPDSIQVTVVFQLDPDEETPTQLMLGGTTEAGAFDHLGVAHLDEREPLGE